MEAAQSAFGFMKVRLQQESISVNRRSVYKRQKVAFRLRSSQRTVTGLQVFIKQGPSQYYDAGQTASLFRLSEFCRSQNLS